MREQKCRKVYRGSPQTILLLRTIPVQPMESTVEDIKKKMNTTYNVDRLIYSLPSSCMICYDKGKYSYPDEEAKRMTLDMYGL